MESAIAIKNGIQDILEQIESVCSTENILSLIKKIDALKVALQAADTFRAQSVKYAKLEASALVRVSELGGTGKLRGFRRKTAEWLYELSEEERNKYISMCEDGLTIEQVYKREVGNNQALNKKIERIEWEQEDLIDECKETGIVDIKQFSDNVREAFKFEHQSLGRDIIDGTRKRLRNAGAVGIGYEGIYVMPHSENADGVKKAIALRYESICKDFGRIREIAKASGVKMSYAEFDNGANWAFANKPYIIHVLLALARFGLMSDEEDLYDAIERNDMRLELAHVTRNLKISREKFIRIEYEKLPKQEEP